MNVVCLTLGGVESCDVCVCVCVSWLFLARLFENGGKAREHHQKVV